MYHQQLCLFELPEFEREFTPDCWETPDDIACAMSKLILPSDRFVCEPAAGTAQIARLLPPGSFCCEIKPQRVKIGKQRACHCHWLNTDFLSLELGNPPLSNFEGLEPGFDLFLSNPPFSLALPFIEQGLRLLNKGNPNARLLYLLPIDFASSIKRGLALQSLDCHLHHLHLIINRVAYIREGIAWRKRQIYDAVFDIRPNQKESAAISFLK